MTQTPLALFLLGGIERIFVVIFQIAMSLLVVYAIQSKQLIYVFVGFLLHMSLDFGAVMLQGQPTWIIEGYCALLAIGGLCFILKGRRLF